MSEEIKKYLSKIGTKGGSAKTTAKATASAQNGAKGGRPVCVWAQRHEAFCPHGVSVFKTEAQVRATMKFFGDGKMNRAEKQKWMEDFWRSAEEFTIKKYPSKGYFPSNDEFEAAVVKKGGERGGKSQSVAKKAAARINGKKGGRPKKMLTMSNRGPDCLLGVMSSGRKKRRET